MSIVSDSISSLRRFFGKTNRVVTLKLIRYSLFMLLIPLATFYFSYIILFKSNKDMLGWSGLLAVIATNCVIVAYVVMAWNEDDDSKAAGDKKKIKGGASKGTKGGSSGVPDVLKVD